MTLGACNMRTEDELMEDRVQRAEAAAKKAVAAQMAAQEALEKIRMEDRDRRSPDEDQAGDEQGASDAMADSSQPEVQNGPSPEG
jgi:ABC-type ATPase involved in cell division